MTTADRIRVTYALLLGDGERAETKAREVALEQTVELPEGCYPDRIAREVVGRVEEVSTTAAGDACAVISYAPAIVDGNVLGLLNLVFGNVSMKSGVRVVSLELPAVLLDGFAGPALGIPGVRRRCAAPRRPLVCAAAKPLGLSSQELAARCAQFAEAGVDLIKDDHSLADQAWAPFTERVSHCFEAVERMNAATGGRTLYLPNLLPGSQSLDAQLAIVRQIGCAGVVLSPWLVGFEALRRVAGAGDLLVLAHPAFSGGFGGAIHGVAADILYGTLCRLAGADGVIYPNARGRFPIREETCMAINDRLREPLGTVRPAFPVAGGGVDADRVGYWVERYGRDTVFLIGSSLYAQDDLVGGTRKVVETVREFEDG